MARQLRLSGAGMGFGRCICSIGCVCVRLRCILCAALRLPGSLRVVPDSLLEGDGFEPSIVARESVSIPEVNWGIDGEAKKFCGYRWFESISLQRRVRCEPFSRDN